MVYTEVTQQDFVDAFRRWPERAETFTYEALLALYDWYEELSDGTGEPTRLDVIAICCEWAEYDSFADVQADYEDIGSLEDLKDHATVIELGNGHLVAQLEPSRHTTEFSSLRFS